MLGADSSPTFISRTFELRALTETFDHACAGSASVVVVGGEAGVGKTRLLEEFASRVRGDALVLIGRCVPVSGQALPYAPFADLFRDLQRQLTASDLVAMLGPARAELRLLVPELDPRRSWSPRAARPAREEDLRAKAVGRARFFELLLGIAERLQGSRPTVVAIDDLQWADAATLDVIRFLSRTVREGRLLLVLAARTDDLATDRALLAALGQVERAASVRRIELPRFGRAEIESLVGAILRDEPDAAMVDGILARSDGNPFFAEELVAAMRRGATEIPPLLDDLLRARLATVSASTRDVLRAASLGGMDVDDEIIEAAAGQAVGSVAPALHEAVDRGLLVRDGRADGRFAFRHALLRESVDRELLPGERRRLHAAWALALERSPHARHVAAETARHWLLAERPERALPALLVAGLESESHFAYADARRAFEAALELIDRVELHGDPDGLDEAAILQHAADDAALTGEPAAAAALARRALAALPSPRAPSREAEIHERLRWYLWEAGDHAGAERALDEAYRLVPQDPPSGARARVIGQAAGHRLRTGRFAESLALADEAIRVARDCGALPELAFALGVRGWVRAVLGDGVGGIADLRDALEMADALGRPEGRALGIANLASLLLEVGRLDEAETIAVDGLATVRALGLERTYGGSLAATAAAAAFLAGRWDRAGILAERALGVAAPGPEAVWPGAVAMRVGAGRGDHDLLRSGRAAAEPYLDAITDRIHGQWYAIGLAEAALWSGRAAEARTITAVAIARSPSGTIDEPVGTLFALWLRATADLAGDAALTRDAQGAAARRSEAAHLVAAWEARRDEAGAAAPWPACADALDALVRAEAGRALGVDDPAGWGDAAGRLASLGLTPAAAYGWFRQAEATAAGASVGSGATDVRFRRAAAAAPLRRARDIAVDIGALPLSTGIRRLAERARIDLPPEPVLEAQVVAMPCGSETPPVRPGGPGAPLASATGRDGASRSVSPIARDPAAAFIASRGLTAREMEVLALVGSGWSNGEIASALFISRKTASVHVSNLMGKLGVADRIEAASIAQRAGMQGPPRPGSVLADLDLEDRRSRP